MNDLLKLVTRLGLDDQNGLYFPKENDCPIELEAYIKRLIGKKLSPDAIFIMDNKPMILFFDNPVDKYSLHRSIWNSNSSPIVIILEKGIVEIYNGYKLSDDPRCRGLLDLIGSDNRIDDFQYFKLVTGETWEKYHKELSQKNRVDYKLLAEIKTARDIILDKFSSMIIDDAIRITNALIGKTIFIRYLIDRKVELNYNNRKVWTNDDYCELLESRNELQLFFEYLADSDKGFNGDLFPITALEFQQIPDEAFMTIKRLINSEILKTGQTALFDFYDFSIIPVEFISSIYESFIGIDNQAKSGAYYTPLFLVDYMLSQTVDAFLAKSSESKCRVLDPACGSGVFLVETLRKLIEKKYLNNKSEDPNHFKNDIKRIVSENIYGIDKDESALQVAVFSVYLTLLDYMEPPEIADYKFPNLMGTNFFNSDYFDFDAPFNTILENVEFSFIVGNPPWRRGGGDKNSFYRKYIDHRKAKENKTNSSFANIGNNEIAQAFLLRNSDFSSSNTICALLSTSKVLYNTQSLKFRKYFLSNFSILSVFELAAVRREVFNRSSSSAIAPPCIITYKCFKEDDSSPNIVEHISLKPSRFFSLFKIFVLSRGDIQYVKQELLMQFDWLWKVLVSGSFMDFNLIKRLKMDYQTIGDVIQEKNLLKGQGLQESKDEKTDATEIVGFPFLNTNEDIKQFWVNPDDKKTWKKKTVHRLRNTDLYKAPVLLIKEGSLDSAIMYKNAVYKDSITGVKGEERDIDLLRQISGLLTSDIVHYYRTMTFSSPGIERGDARSSEILSLPIPKTNTQLIVKELEELMRQKYSNKGLKDLNIENSIEKAFKSLNYEINKAFSISDYELDLIDYAKMMANPSTIKEIKDFTRCVHEDSTIADYAKVFLRRFAPVFNDVENNFIIDIQYSEHIIGMRFKVKQHNDAIDKILWSDMNKNPSDFIRYIISLGGDKITDRLFIQKDVRGFDAEGFYIFKPNEKRLWHKAIAYTDAEEFARIMLEIGASHG